MALSAVLILSFFFCVLPDQRQHRAAPVAPARHQEDEDGVDQRQHQHRQEDRHCDNGFFVSALGSCSMSRLCDTRSYLVLLCFIRPRKVCTGLYLVLLGFVLIQSNLVSN